VVSASVAASSAGFEQAAVARARPATATRAIFFMVNSPLARGGRNEQKREFFTSSRYRAFDNNTKH
jgi:hypothetical protein